MRIFTFIAGVVCLFAALFDAFQTIILPRRATGRFRLTRIFYITTWRPWVFFTKRIRDFTVQLSPTTLEELQESSL